MNNKPILFYSKQNASCVNLWNTLAKNNQLDNFVKICTDNNNKIPPMITTVPTIFIKGRPLITGPSIAMFLNSNHSMVETPINTRTNHSNSINARNSGGSSNQNPAPSQGAPDAHNGVINDFNPVEMSDRWSDSYSFIDDNNKSTPMSYCYQFLDNNSGSLNTSNNAPSQQQNTIPASTRKNNQLDDRLEKLQIERGMLNNNLR